MTLLAIIAVVAVLGAFLAIKFVKGMIKFGVLAAVVLVCLYIAHRVGAF